MATALYCDLDTDVANLLSANGVSYRLDDTPPDSDGDVIDDASAEIDEYCLLLYSESELLASRWVKHQCAAIAAMKLCERRGNPVPAGIAQKYERAIAKLERVQLGRLQIPDAAQRRTIAPLVSNVRVRLDPFPRTVVEKNRSSRVEAQDYKQNMDRLDWLDYSI